MSAELYKILKQQPTENDGWLWIDNTYLADAGDAITFITKEQQAKIDTLRRDAERYRALETALSSNRGGLLSTKFAQVDYEHYLPDTLSELVDKLIAAQNDTSSR